MSFFLWSGVHGNAARSAKASELNDLNLRRLQQDEVVYEQFKRDVLPSLSTAINVGELAIPPYFFGGGGPTFNVRDIQLEGTDRLGIVAHVHLVRPYLFRSITADDIRRLMYELTQWYVSKGYVTTRVYVAPGEGVSDGVLRLRVVEGHVSDVKSVGLPA